MNEEQLYAMRHSTAHILAAAIQELFPGTKFGVGPVVEHGFYYDVLLPEGKMLTTEDLPILEEKMKEIISRNDAFIKKEMSLDEAIAFFEKMAQQFKVELLNDLKTKGTTSMQEDETAAIDSAKPSSATIYATGSFVDLCRGPHVAKSVEIGAFKLDTLAGAYWRGKNTNPQLQRVYGFAFATQKELDAHLAMLEEAKKRDHRKIGQEQELFLIDDMVGKGLVLWLPNGEIIRREIETWAIEKETQYGYTRVSTPHLAKEELFITSGHLPYYKEGMFPAMSMDDGNYYLRAMNCPHHHIIFRHRKRSYRELPLRLAEYGTVYRNELSGTLAGLLRVRGLAMNDAHLYCRKEQIKEEFGNVLKLTLEYFETLGLKDYHFRLSKWSPLHLEKYINEPEHWTYCEQVLREVMQEMGVACTEVEDEAAFYGPKIDVQFRSVIGREETMSTIQLDFAAKKRFGLEYTDETGNPNNEIFVIHRSPLSTHERFMAFLIEHFGGAWPLWLAPVQVIIAAVGSSHVPAAEKLAHTMRASNIRVHIDASNETVGNKIRKSAAQKIPYMIVYGDREMGSETLPVRVRGKKDLLEFSVSDCIAHIVHLIALRSNDL